MPSSDNNPLVGVLKAAQKAQAADADKPRVRKRGSRKPVDSQPVPETPAAVGRPRTGKRSDPTYAQRGFWLSNATSAQLDIELARAMRDGEDLGDRSDVVEILLTQWFSTLKR